MRILFVSNFYPPARPGGYTQWCHEVAEGLRARGHTIGVLTSRHEREKAPDKEQHIYRLLHLNGDLVRYQPLHFFRHWRRERRENVAVVGRVIEAFDPDLIFIWGMWAMSHSVPAEAERLRPSRIVYFLSDYWPSATDMHTAYWQSAARRWYTQIPRKLLGAVALRRIRKEEGNELEFRHPICVSAAVRDILVRRGAPVEHARIIHGGTRLDGFKQVAERDFCRRPLRLLYAGQIVEHKGVHTAVEAMARLAEEANGQQFRLNIVGSGHPDYESSLRRFVQEQELHKNVLFHGRLEKEQMPSVLRDTDVLVFPSIYEEPFARMTQEAMLAGAVVVGTTTGGTKEILREGVNGLTFEAEDAAGLASQLRRLEGNPALCARLAAAGRRTVLNNYTLDIMVNRIESYLQEVLASAAPRRAVPEWA